MSHPVITIDEDADIEDAASLMLSHKVARLPVVMKGRLTGIVTRADIVRGVGGPSGHRGSTGVKSICGVAGVKAWGIKEGKFGLALIEAGGTRGRGLYSKSGAGPTHHPHGAAHPERVSQCSHRELRMRKCLYRRPGIPRCSPDGRDRW